MTSDLQEICDRLDAPVVGVGNYRTVALYYGIDDFRICTVLEEHCGGPSKALIEHLSATIPNLTVLEFASVVRKEAHREDVVRLLEQYNLI